MPSEPINRLLDFARGRDHECEIVGDEARVFIPNRPFRGSTSVRARLNELGQLSFELWFGRMPAIYEMAVSMTFFAVLLTIALVNRSDRSPPFVAYLAVIVFVGNACFEAWRFRKAKKFISEAKRAI